MTKKKAIYKWEPDQQQSFSLLKKMLVVAPILQPLDWRIPFHIFLDASHISIRAVLM